ncbi:murein DD-endopeptidase MepM/ murein hydrolase activator NlpD [Flavobacterium arsenatis]|uniref:Murein DD-endopeptidase MepM/ murein hydrolase activator NlpD n=1 Tax=Flavobacterium arsenatis TaxID=1484332 RepID=A0ABU1TNL8_9FLAO|nr:peptidoglycan DD-metalloendopeptidase family protein [Flavobacterium arsenatis]MDR6967545.1 murein DD-endopeptidase MepM/ murein hydrolase activator NlpD [Flavobacterium arsenatis]
MSPLESVLLAQKNVKVIDASIPYQQYKPIDLSISNTALLTLKNVDDFEDYISNYLKKDNAKVAFGGYKEFRNLYKRSNIFNDIELEERNIHIGIDLWIKEETPVLSALDGIVHSFDYNVGLGNYGPTIILKHKIDGVEFYTLYGHLSIESIETLKIGTTFKAGEQLGTLGDSSVNGDYAPHLHFQIIDQIEDYEGDYPGVSSQNDLDFYLKNCPNPDLLLKINEL